MKNKKSILIGGILAALLVTGVIGATNVYAQGPTTTPTTPPANLGAPLRQDGFGKGHGRGLGQAELDAAAKALNMTSDEFRSALQSGKTLEQIAQDANVDIQKVKDAIQAAHVAEMRTQIQQAVTDGTITQANADWLLEGLDKGYIGIPGAFGFGHGFGGPHGHGFGPGSNQNNQTPPSQQQPTQPSPTQSSG